LRCMTWDELVDRIHRMVFEDEKNE